MSNSLKGIIVAIFGFIGLIFLISVALIYFVDNSTYKQRLEKAAADALGMEVSVGGRAVIGLFPKFHIRLHDIHIRNHGMDIVSVQEGSLEVAFLPLLSKELRITRIVLQHPRIYIKKDRDGVFNFKERKETRGTFLTMDLDEISLNEGIFFYEDEQSGEKLEAGNFKLGLSSLRIAGGRKGNILKNLSFTAEFVCRELRTKDFVLADVKFKGEGKDGIIALDPFTMHLYGGQGSANIKADFSDTVPSYSVRLSLPKLRIEEYLKAFNSKKVAEGSMDLSASLSMQGNTTKEITQSVGGQVSLRGKNLTLYGNDLDREFARFESSQKFNLLDAGALFFTGPLGLGVTKGYNFANTLQRSGGNTHIVTLLSDWKVERGIAQARDVALATKQNRIALTGKLNLVNERFDDITIALIDVRGCARVQQKIRGPFRKPLVEKPNILMFLTEPALNLLKQARDLFAGGKCKVFYAGSVPAP